MLCCVVELSSAILCKPCQVTGLATLIFRSLNGHIDFSLTCALVLPTVVLRYCLISVECYTFKPLNLYILIP
jgi:hypothetical protein